MDISVESHRRSSLGDLHTRPVSPRSVPQYQRSPRSPRHHGRHYSKDEASHQSTPSQRFDDDGKVSLPPIRDLLGPQAAEPTSWISAPKPVQSLLQAGWTEDTGSHLHARQLAPPAPITITREHIPSQPLYESPTSSSQPRRQSYPSVFFAPHPFGPHPSSATDLGPPPGLDSYEHRRSFASTNSTSSAGTVASYSTGGTSTIASSPTSMGPGFFLVPQHAQPSLGPPPHNMQRRLPIDFPPRLQAVPPHSPTTALSADVSPTSAHSDWHHSRARSHSQPQIHYMPHGSSSVSGTNFSQDRYVCPTCNKAFSRPSSLRIHSHSHTGEKPFRCPQKGCGKAFSVRSNMKRHERGCHAERRSGDPAVPAGVREILPAGG